MPGDHARWYRIVVRGEAGSLLASSLREIEVTSFRGWTSITAPVRDLSEFYGLLDRLEDFALRVVSVNELADRGAGSARGADRTGEAWLAGAAGHDPAVLEPSLSLAEDTGEILGLDIRSRPLVRLAALVATGAGDELSAYRWHVIQALDQGVTIDEIAGVLMALLPTVGTARVAVAASAIRAVLDRAPTRDSVHQL
jgi:alkylhydroperoxidase/carboxymuconolactone decarboxylase family protein YurZ